MPVTFPSDPVTNGATEIQATVFNVVAADYSRAEAGAVVLFTRARASLRGLPQIVKGVMPIEWMFFMRKDMSGTSAGLRNLIGIRTTQYVQQQSGFSSALGKQIVVPATITRIDVYNWYAQRITMTDSTVLHYWTTASGGLEIVANPETGELEVLAGGNHRPVYEALGFLFTQVAAGNPTLTPSYQLASGLSPLG